MHMQTEQIPGSSGFTDGGYPEGQNRVTAWTVTKQKKGGRSVAIQDYGRKKVNQLQSVTLAMLACALMAGPAMQANAEINQNTNTGGNSGKTEVNLGVAREVKQVSFEVPLYYTAVIANDPNGADGRKNKIVYPTRYGLCNTNTKEKLVVTTIDVSGINGSSWKIVDAVTDQTGTTKEMAVQIGGISLPAVTDGETTKQKNRRWFSAKTAGTNSQFYSQQENRYIPLGEGRTDGMTYLNVNMDIPKNYEVAQGTGDSAVAQFRLFYMVAPLGDDGKPIGIYRYNQEWVDQHYEGPEKETAENGNTAP